MQRFVLLMCLLVSPAFALQNQLQDHPSPYLAMHGSDPVAWQDWGEPALQKARDEKKLLFISSGYFSCHWCHVMQRESYSNPEIARWLNEHFIPVKLDRELHPALDAYLIDFLQHTQGHAGWPLNIFLTPEGYPLIGATYLPARRFENLLGQLSELWRTEQDKTRNLARTALLQMMAEDRSDEVEPLPKSTLRESLIRHALSIGDVMEGGFGQQNKFPMSPQWLALLEVRGKQPHRALDSLLLLTLDQIAEQGLRDHIGGGFFRYSVDPSWQVPHYEKMLYNQAQLSRLFLRAGKTYARTDYLEIARDTLDFVLRDMKGEQGGLIASFSAVDGKGEEGAAYLWSVEQLVAALGNEDAALARRYWAMRDVPATDGAYLPRRGDSLTEISQDLKQSEASIAERLGQIREKLLLLRGQRDLPADTKELAAWNGLMISALSEAAQQLGEPRYLQAAIGLRDFIYQHLWQGDALWRARSGDKAVGNASLADYAYVAQGMDKLAAVSGDPADIVWRDRLIAEAWRRFYSAAGWRSSDRALIPGMRSASAESDGALASATGVILGLSLKSTDASILERAQSAASLSRQKTQADPFRYATHLLALLDFRQP